MTGKWYNSLQAQILFLLTIALLPLGTVAIYQTNQVANEARRNAELALLALTEQAAQTEEEIIQRAIGTADFLASLAPSLTRNVDQCNEYLANFTARQDDFSFVGILPIDGIMRCSSTGEVFDFSDFPNFETDMENQTRTIKINPDAPLSGTSVFIVSEPFQVNGAFGGFVSVSIPHDGLPTVSEKLDEMGLVDLITFDPDGIILTARSDIETAEAMLPTERSLANLANWQSVAFQGTNGSGEPRVYTVVPIQGSPANVLGVWRPNSDASLASIKTSWASVFPLLMWLASMAVAMLSIYLLVLRNLSRMQRGMDRFADTREFSPVSHSLTMPNELQALQNNFDRMADQIMRDEAAMENTVREKNVLIKEVHHRVKNNLQLISSIMNMQIRQAEHDETKSALSRLQDRVLSLATIHRDLYQSQDGGMVQVGALIVETVERATEAAFDTHPTLDVSTDIAPTLLYPDQAVPLSLLVAEAVVNAAKFVSAADGNRPWINVTLERIEDELRLVVANSRGGEEIAVEPNTAMGTQLMNAFAIQLGGKISVQAEPDSYLLTVRFRAQRFIPDQRDF